MSAGRLALPRAGRLGPGETQGETGSRLGEVLRIRGLACLGAHFRVGVGPTDTLAATASAQVPASVVFVKPAVLACG